MNKRLMWRAGEGVRRRGRVGFSCIRAPGDDSGFLRTRSAVRTGRSGSRGRGSRCRARGASRPFAGRFSRLSTERIAPSAPTISRSGACAQGCLAPITVYRALDFLIEQRLVHRLATRNTYMPCPHEHRDAAPIAFLICRSCGGVDEVVSPALAQSLGTPLGRRISLARDDGRNRGILLHCSGVLGA